MTLIDKAEALAPCPFCGGEAEWKSGGPGCAWISCKSCPAETSDGSIPRIMEAWNRRAALPARGVGVKPLIFSEFKEGGCMGRPHQFQYFITQAHNGRFLCHHDETWHETLEAAQAHAQVAYQVAALAPTDAAQAREAALAAIKAGFWSAAPGEWRVSDIERVTDAILRALEQEGRE